MKISVEEAAEVLGILPGRLRSWQQRSVVNFGTKTPTGRIYFNLRELRILAILRELTEHGFPPNHAARIAPQIVDRSQNRALIAVVSRDPLQSPMLIPNDTLNLSNHAVITIALAPLWADIDIKIREMQT